MHGKVLIIEDDDLYFEGLYRLFKLQADNVFHAQCLSAAIEVLEIQHFDLIVADLGLPDFGNAREEPATRIQIFKTIQSYAKAAGVMVITGRYSDEEAQYYRNEGALGYFSKAQLNSPALVNLLERLGKNEGFVQFSGAETIAKAKEVACPALSLSEEECVRWVEGRPSEMKKVEVFSLMARHFNLKNPQMAERKYKRARSKVLSYIRSFKSRSTSLDQDA